MPQPTPLWLDCDPGHDDAFAILLAAHHPSLRLLGVSTVHGNASLEQTTRNAGSVLTAIGRSDIHVYPGARKPFCRQPVHAQDIHGASGLDGTERLPAPSSPPITDVPAVIAMRDALLAQPRGTAWLVATGTLTNAALLFASFPDLIRHLKGMSIMGGAIGDGFTTAPLGQVGSQVRIGNITPYAEFNIYCDPEAARSIFSVPELASKTWLVPLDVTHLALATADVQRRLLHGDHGPEMQDSKPSSLRQMFHDLLLFFAKTYNDVFSIPAPPLHDPLAVAILLDSAEEHFDYRRDQAKGGERWIVDVITSGEHDAAHAQGTATVGDDTGVGMVGRTQLQPCQTNLDKGESMGSRVPRSVDLEWFWNHMLAAVELADKYVQHV